MIFIAIKSEGAMAWLSGYPSRLRANLEAVMKRLAIQLQGNVKELKLSGQVLHTRTGTLRRSINQKVEVSPTSVVATVGTNVAYAAVHEYGFDGTVTVQEHVRRSRAQMSLARFRTNKLGERIEIKGSYAKAGGGSGEILVHTHDRHMKMPERSFLRSALKDMELQIVTNIKQAAVEAKNG